MGIVVHDSKEGQKMSKFVSFIRENTENLPNLFSPVYIIPSHTE